MKSFHLLRDRYLLRRLPTCFEEETERDTGVEAPGIDHQPDQASEPASAGRPCESIFQKTSRPQYAPRPKRPDILDPYKDFITVRLKDGVWNAVVLMRELKAARLQRPDTAIKDYLRPRRQQAHAAAVRRFETPPGKQAQVDVGPVRRHHL